MPAGIGVARSNFKSRGDKRPAKGVRTSSPTIVDRAGTKLESSTDAIAKVLPFAEDARNCSDLSFYRRQSQPALRDLNRDCHLCRHYPGDGELES